jgi:hypothetical protein
VIAPMIRRASSDLKNFFTLADPVPTPTQTRGRKAATLRRPSAKTDDKAKSRRRSRAFGMIYL